jgi:hypothetical protein
LCTKGAHLKEIFVRNWDRSVGIATRYAPDVPEI